MIYSETSLRTGFQSFLPKRELSGPKTMTKEYMYLVTSPTIKREGRRNAGSSAAQNRQYRDDFVSSGRRVKSRGLEERQERLAAKETHQQFPLPFPEIVTGPKLSSKKNKLVSCSNKEPYKVSE